MVQHSRSGRDGTIPPSTLPPTALSCPVGARSGPPGSRVARKVDIVKQALIMIAVLLPLLIGATAFSLWSWNAIGDTPIGVQGYIALGLGVIATLVIGGGLMWLVFYSARHGYDERAGRDPAQPDD